MSPAPGTTRYLCPLECGWHHDVPPPSFADMAGVSVEPPPETWPEYFNGLVAEVSRQRSEETETALREHLDTHTTVEFATTIHGLRQEISRLKRDQEAPA